MEPTQNRSLYDAGSAEIFRKHFLAGFAQGLGGFFVTLATWAIILYVSAVYVLPQITATLTQLQDTIKLIPGSGEGQKTPVGTPRVLPSGSLK